MIRILILFLVCFELNSQCIVLSEPPPPGVPISPSAINITFNTASQETRRNTGPIRVDVNGLDTSTGDFIQLIIDEVDGTGTFIGNLVDVKFIKAGQIGTDYFDDVGNAWQNDFLPYIPVGDQSDMAVNNDMDFVFNKFTWAKALGYTYMDGTDSGTDWISAAKRLEWKIGTTDEYMDRAVDYVNGGIGYTFQNSGTFTIIDNRVNASTALQPYMTTATISLISQGVPTAINTPFVVRTCNAANPHTVCLLSPSPAPSGISPFALGYELTATMTNGMESYLRSINGVRIMHFSGVNNMDPVYSVTNYDIDLESTAATGFRMVPVAREFSTTVIDHLELTLDGTLTSYPGISGPTDYRYITEQTVTCVFGTRYQGRFDAINFVGLNPDGRIDFEYELHYIY